MRRAITKEEIIAALKRFNAEHGRPPTVRECNDDSSIPSETTITRKFGSYNAALGIAGLKHHAHRRGGELEISDEQLLNRLRELVKKIGFIPSAWDMGKYSGKTYSGLYLKRFGSLEAALKKAGIRHSSSRYWLRRALRHYFHFGHWLVLKLREPYRE